MQNAQLAKHDHASKDTRLSTGSGRKMPPRYFVDGRIPPNLETAKKRLALIRKELEHTSNLVNSAADMETDTKRHNNRKKFVAHTEKEISGLTDWIGKKEAEIVTANGGKKALMSAHDIILDAHKRLLEVDRKSLLSPRQVKVYDSLSEYVALT